MAKGSTATDGQQSLAVREEAALAVPLDEMAADGGLGMEHATSEDIATPFLRMLQKGSPQCDESRAEYIGGKPGWIFNGVTGEVFEDGIQVVHCAFRREIVEWRMREKGGGFVAVYDPGDPATEKMLAECTRDDKSRDVRPGGETHLQVTHMHYVLLESGEPAVIAMASTQLKHSRAWNSRMAARRVTTSDGRSFTPPTFAYFYLLSARPESNAKGSWMSWKIENGEPVTRDLYEQAKAFHALVGEGRARVVEDIPNDAGDDAAQE